MRRILFVDDELRVLDGLRDSLRKQRREWSMVFALGGEAALRELARAPFDVVVSDMRMPGLDGASLLARVQEEHPDVVRIVLSGQAELEGALRAVPVAHQFLAKPCDSDELRRVIERSCRLHELLADEALRAVVGGVKALPSAPRVYTALTEALANPETSAEEVGDLIEQDVAICAKVLQLVNSAFFGLGRRITSVQEAVVYLGIGTLKALVLVVGAVRAFESSQAIEGFSIEALEAHSLRVARTASLLLRDRRDSDDALAAGMLHDIGKLVLASDQPHGLEALLAAAREAELPLHAVEAQNRGVTHAEIGAYLLALWGLPHAVVEAVANHHTPTRTADRRLDPLAAVYIANLLVSERERLILGDRGQACEPPDMEYLGELGVLERLPSWRALAAEQADAVVGAC